MEARNHPVRLTPPWLALASQFRSRFRQLGMLYLPPLLGFGALMAVQQVSGTPLRVFFIDPVSHFDGPMYIGLVSNLGIVAWCAAAAVSIFSGYLLRDCPDEEEVSQFLLSGGILTAILMFDDLLLLHEQLLPNRLHIPQNVVLVTYALMIAAFLVRFRRFITQHTDILGLLLALGFFSVSVVVDMISTWDSSELTVGNALWALGEDGMKFLGIFGWTAYFLGMSLQAVGRRMRRV